MDSIEIYKRNHLQEAIDWSEKADKLRQNFLELYPKESIKNLTLDDYLIAPEGFGREKSFCYMIRRNMQTICSMGNAREECFGVYCRGGTTITLNKTLNKRFGGNYIAAYDFIKNEIVKLLSAVEEDDYETIESLNLYSNFKHKLLSVYYPEKFIPVCTKAILDEYCARMGLNLPSDLGMIYKNLALVELRDSIPDIQDWNNSVIMSFCVWLIKNNLKIDGTSLKVDRISYKATKLNDEIENLNLEGKTKEAVVKVRVNQGDFRNILLGKNNKCCLCGVSNPSLLIASHIKPWAESDSHEKLDYNNGFLMCPNHDKLFDSGLITFDSEGNIIVSESLSETDKIFMNVNSKMKIKLTEGNKKYLEFHRNNVFKN